MVPDGCAGWFANSSLHFNGIAASLTCFQLRPGLKAWTSAELFGRFINRVWLLLYRLGFLRSSLFHLVLADGYKSCLLTFRGFAMRATGPLFCRIS